MSWRDGMRFQKRLKELDSIQLRVLQSIFNSLVLPKEKGKFEKLLESIYQAGYRDGYRESQYYDPKWDAD